MARSRRAAAHAAAGESRQRADSEAGDSARLSGAVVVRRCVSKFGARRAARRPARKHDGKTRLRGDDGRLSLDSRRTGHAR